MSEGRVNALDALGAIAGIKQEEIDKIKLQVKENLAKLNACALHRFIEQTPGKFGGGCVCANCGGRVGSIEARWYQRGLEHGKAVR